MPQSKCEEEIVSLTEIHSSSSFSQAPTVNKEKKNVI